VLREIERLGGTVDDAFEPVDWRVETPVGERPVPPAVQAVLSVRWPSGHLLVTGEDEYEVTFPQLVNGDPIAEDRACFEIAFNEDTQYYWVIDLDDERPDDPMVHVIDHDVPDDEDLFDHAERLSAMLAGLVVFEPPAEALFGRACAFGDVETVREGLGDLGPVDESGLTPLHLAAISRSAEVVRLLMEAGADPNAAITGQGSIGPEYLHLDSHYGGRLNPGATPLHYAVDAHGPRSNSMPDVVAEVVRILLDGGADPHALDDSGRTPLNVAASGHEGRPVNAEQVEVLRLLLAAGSDPEAESPHGSTPLMRAVSQPELVRVLLDAGADPVRLTGYEIWGVEGVSALHYAALVQWAPPETVRLMLERAADPNVRTAQGTTPLDCAVKRDEPEITALLDVHQER
jgi:ankyrin repeat protein